MASTRRICDNCRLPSDKTKLCSGCSSARYCSSECQKINWPTHKEACKFIQEKIPVGGIVSPGSHCGYCARSQVNLLKCGKCKLITYCNKDCQKKDWVYHKDLCGKPNFKVNNIKCSEFLSKLVITLRENSYDMLKDLL